MAVFGWIVLFVIVLYAWAYTLLLGWANLALRGKPGGETLFLLVVACLLTYLAYRTFPFVVTVAP